MSKLDRPALVSAWRAELDAARAARQSRDLDRVWHHLGRAHVLSQPLAGRHVRTHGTMFVQGCRQRSVKEVAGQVGRLVVAGPASLLGRYPTGNSGRATESAFTPMPIPDDLVAVLTPRSAD